MLVTSDLGLQKYLQQVLSQLSGLLNHVNWSDSCQSDAFPTEWLYAGSVQKLVLVITSLETQQVESRLPFFLKFSISRCLILSHLAGSGKMEF